MTELCLIELQKEDADPAPHRRKNPTSVGRSSAFSWSLTITSASADTALHSAADGGDR